MKIEDFAKQVSKDIPDNNCYIAIMINDDHYDLEIEVDEGHIAANFDTDSKSLKVARKKANELQKSLEKLGITVHETREDWENYLEKMIVNLVNLNSDYEKRNKIVFGKNIPTEWLGGVEHFENLTLKQFESLVDNRFIDLEDVQNLSPSAGDFLEFMRSHSKVTAHGYVVSHERQDCRVSIEGLSYKGKVSKNLLLDFVHLCREADEFVADDNHLYSWWD